MRDCRWSWQAPRCLTATRWNEQTGTWLPPSNSSHSISSSQIPTAIITQTTSYPSTRPSPFKSNSYSISSTRAWPAREVPSKGTRSRSWARSKIIIRNRHEWALARANPVAVTVRRSWRRSGILRQHLQSARHRLSLLVPLLIEASRAGERSRGFNPPNRKHTSSGVRNHTIFQTLWLNIFLYCRHEPHRYWNRLCSRVNRRRTNITQGTFAA